MLLAMLALPIAMQAQTKFHDVEMNEAKGAVKSISTSLMGREQVTTFDENGKMMGTYGVVRNVTNSRPKWRCRASSWVSAASGRTVC